jgi:uncharacterized protein YegL
MSKVGLTEIICIIDKSGSMQSIAEDAIGGFNSFLAQQKAFKGEASFTLVLFDTAYNKLYDGVDIQSVIPLTMKVYLPNGCTALLDAIGKTVDAVGKRLSETSEEKRPEKVIVVILTDGLENSSTDYTKEQINKMITHQREVYKWEFLYLAANQDAFQEGSKYGVSVNQTSNYPANGKGIKHIYTLTGQTVSSYRSGGSADIKNNNGGDNDNR